MAAAAAAAAAIQAAAMQAAAAATAAAAALPVSSTRQRPSMTVLDGDMLQRFDICRQQAMQSVIRLSASFVRPVRFRAKSVGALWLQTMLIMA